MDEFQIEDIPQVSILENEFLTTNFTEDEVRTAVFQMEHNKAPGLDGFPLEFYQVFWSLIKDDLMALFTDFYDGSLPLNSLNFGTMILLPKQKDVKAIQQYRSLLTIRADQREDWLCSVHRQDLLHLPLGISQDGVHEA